MRNLDSDDDDDDDDDVYGRRPIYSSWTYIDILLQFHLRMESFLLEICLREFYMKQIKVKSLEILVLIPLLYVALYTYGLTLAICPHTFSMELLN